MMRVASLALLFLTSVEGLLDAHQLFRAIPTLEARGRAAPPALVAAAARPEVRRGPVEAALGFVAGFDLEEFGKGVKDFALGGIAGVRTLARAHACAHLGSCPSCARFSVRCFLRAFPPREPE